MGTDHDRARARSRLAATAAKPGRADGHDTADDPGDAGSDWAPGWLGDHEAAADEPDWSPAPSRWRGVRLSPGRGGAVVLVAVGLVAAIVAAFSVWRDRPTAQAVPPLPVVEVRESADPGADAHVGATASADPTADPAPPPEELVVSVVGLVNQAGLVRLPAGSRVADALAAAGGPRPGADVLGLNMAERVDDGDQILVGALAPDGAATTVGSARVGAGSAPAGQPAAGAAGAAGGRAGKVNLNTAAEADLDALPGVGPVTAAAIVSWRQSNGKFTDIEQLGEVDGIGPARLAKLRELVTL